MNASRKWVSICAVVGLLAGTASADTFGTGANEFDIDFVPISGATNPIGGYGIVNTNYRIGVYEITNDQWIKFKAEQGVPVTGDPLSAYDSEPYWTGTNVPTNRASWYEAAQFVNWLNTSTNHQASYRFTGTQGQSDYTFDTRDDADARHGMNHLRHKDAFYCLSDYDEWFKVAYWNGTSIQDDVTKPGDTPHQEIHPHQRHWPQS